MNSSSKPEDVIVRLNIKWVLEKVRHRVPGFYRFTEDQEKDLVRGFLATYGEIQGLLRDPCATRVGTLWILVYETM